jgi:2-keto-3-deoxy-L-fuconate dehydrogenase
MVAGKRILVTHAADFMGPALCEALTQHGAHVIADPNDLHAPDAPARVVAAAGVIDVVVINQGYPAPSSWAHETPEEEWRNAFAALVDPLPRLMKAVLPDMIARKRGKVLLIGSATALRGSRRTSTYSAARGAQLAYIQSVGVEVAPHNIQVNAIAQNFVENPTYYGPEVQANPKFQERLKREVPLGRLVSANEDVQFAAYLCSEAANCFVGQVFPVNGGWATR